MYMNLKRKVEALVEAETAAEETLKYSGVAEGVPE